MNAWDWSPFLVGGGTRPDAMTGLAPEFGSALAALFQAAPPEVQQNLRVTSAYRSPEVQERLWADALAKYGSEAAARKWVAPPGRSNHNHGAAVDFKFLDPSAQEWVHQNAGQFGMHFPMSHEPWHIEMAGDDHVPNLTFGSGVPSAPQNGMAAMFSPLPLSMGAPGEPAAAPFQQQRDERQRRDDDQRSRRSELAKLIRY